MEAVYWTSQISRGFTMQREKLRNVLGEFLDTFEYARSRNSHFFYLFDLSEGGQIDYNEFPELFREK